MVSRLAAQHPEHVGVAQVGVGLRRGVGLDGTGRGGLAAGQWSQGALDEPARGHEPAHRVGQDGAAHAQAGGQVGGAGGVPTGDAGAGEDRLGDGAPADVLVQSPTDDLDLGQLRHRCRRGRSRRCR